MDNKINPTSLMMNVTLTEDKNRNKVAAKDKDSSGNSKEKPQKKQNKYSIDYQDLLKKVAEVNAILSTMGENILVLIHKNKNEVVIKIVETRSHGLITQMTPLEFYELAQNLRNHKLNLIDRDV